MKRQIKFNSQEQQQSSMAQQHQQSSGLDFASAEEMLRHDALHTPVPPHIASRLQESLSQLPTPKPSWWRRLFGGV